MTAKPPTPPAEALRVLVIDDSEVARGMICATLRTAGFVVFELRSAIGATRLVADRTIDFVVIDVQMPSMNGDRLAALLRKNPRFDGVSLILVSESFDEAAQGLADTAGVNAVVSKRNIAKELAPTIRRIARDRSIVASGSGDKPNA